MKRTLPARNAEDMLAAAARYGVAPADWAAMSRGQRKALKRRRQGKWPMGVHQWSKQGGGGRG